jgi:hypothetical protein
MLTKSEEGIILREFTLYKSSSLEGSEKFPPLYASVQLTFVFITQESDEYDSLLLTGTLSPPQLSQNYILKF